jgi:hypothetical protein
MDGKGWYSDNLFIERLWRIMKCEGVYLKAYQDSRESRISLGNYFRFYNTESTHRALDYRTPAEVLTSITVESAYAYGDTLESLTPDPMRIVEPNLNTVSILS